VSIQTEVPLMREFDIRLAALTAARSWCEAVRYGIASDELVRAAEEEIRGLPPNSTPVDVKRAANAGIARRVAQECRELKLKLAAASVSSTGKDLSP